MRNNAVLDNNVQALRSCYPEIARRLDGYADKDNLQILQTKEDHLTYGLNINGETIPIIDANDAVNRISLQINQNSTQLLDFTRPVLLVGLYPGDELFYLFDLSDKAKKPHAEQNIHVCIDSLHCLYGFLNAFDAKEIIKSPRVKLFWHEDVEKEVDYIRNNPEHPPIFTVISGSPNGTVNKVLTPFINLSRELAEETKRLWAENNAYYDSITDEQLAATISQANQRQPRLMLPTSSWSSVTQYSARDTAELFQKSGWEVRKLNMDTMLTPYYLAKQINEFKPDLFLFINHLRTEALQAYPKNMMFLTWIQDAIPSINNKPSALTWNNAIKTQNRDLIIGYIDQLRKYDYLEERLMPFNMVVNTDLFKPQKLTHEQAKKYSCDVCFSSNRSMPTDEIIASELIPLLSHYGFKKSLLKRIHDYLWQHYRQEKTLTSYKTLETKLYELNEFKKTYNILSKDDQDQVIQVLFWRLNDAIYRHVVLEWCVKLGVNLHIYGKGWENHPVFGKYAKGNIEHGKELSIAYQGAKFCLHLNSMEGTHQRLLEIMASGRKPLTRSSLSNTKCSTSKKPAKQLYEIKKSLISDSWNEKEREILTTYIWSRSFQHLDSAEHSDKDLLNNVLTDMQHYIKTSWKSNTNRFDYPKYEFSSLKTFRSIVFSDFLKPEKTPRKNIKTQIHQYVSEKIQKALCEILDLREDISTLSKNITSTIKCHPSSICKAALLIKRIRAGINKSEQESIANSLLSAFNQIKHPSFAMKRDLVQSLLTLGNTTDAHSIALSIEQDSLTTDDQSLHLATILASVGETEKAIAITKDLYKKNQNIMNGYKTTLNTSDTFDGYTLFALAAFSPDSHEKLISFMEKDLYLGRLSPSKKVILAYLYSRKNDKSKSDQLVSSIHAETLSMKQGLNFISAVRKQMHFSRESSWLIWIYRICKQITEKTGLANIAWAEFLQQLRRFKEAENYISCLSSPKAKALNSFIHKDWANAAKQYTANNDSPLMQLISKMLSGDKSAYNTLGKQEAFLQTTQSERALALRWRGIYSRHLNNLDSSINNLAESLEHFPENELTRFQLGLSMHQKGKNEEAINILSEDIPCHCKGLCLSLASYLDKNSFISLETLKTSIDQATAPMMEHELWLRLRYSHLLLQQGDKDSAMNCLLDISSQILPEDSIASTYSSLQNKSFWSSIIETVLYGIPQSDIFREITTEQAFQVLAQLKSATKESFEVCVES